MRKNGKYREPMGWSRSVVCDTLLAFGVLISIALSITALIRTSEAEAIRELTREIKKLQ